VKLLAVRMDGADAKTLRESMDKLKDKLKSAVIVLAVVDGDKVQLAAGVTADVMGRVKAGELVNHVASQGRWQGRRQVRHGDGRRHRAQQAGQRPGLGAGVGRRAGLKRSGPPGTRCAGCARPARFSVAPLADEGAACPAFDLLSF
jgi:hypothetical protein